MEPRTAGAEPVAGTDSQLVDPSRRFRHAGFVQLTRFEVGIGARPLNAISAHFLELEEPASAAQLQALASVDGLEGCLYSVESDDGEPLIAATMTGDRVVPIDRASLPNTIDRDAGERLVLSSSEGSLLELAQHDDVGLYVGAGPLRDGDLPEGLSLSIPGADFPPVAAVPLPPLAPLSQLELESTPDGTPLRIEWDAGGAVGSMSLSLTRLDADGALTALFCVTPDNGTFEVPEQIRAAVGRDLQGAALVGVRQRTTVTQDGEVLVFATRSSVLSTDR